MSVLMILRVKGDGTKLEELARKQPDAFASVAQKGRANGAIHHQFYASGDEVVVIDEWDSEDSFHSFFNSTPDIPRFMEEAGVTSAPEITFFRKLELGDSF